MSHSTHCCVLHGCKYGEYDTCEVCTGEVKQHYLCESCYDETNNIVNQRKKINNLFLQKNRKLKLNKIKNNVL